jgi:hypothetical protein
VTLPLDVHRMRDQSNATIRRKLRLLPARRPSAVLPSE